ncbi:glycosyltransferase family 2 protein [Alienimonas californiensis]|uniref:Chondroitin synthase n=1 Tax=Alienimonas californiensis TaxID=2527989 RepID=A0A517PCR2_9PLAN|nr:glycosyltransferase [Alienimonas californiensis]QDT17173.1 Chondroitin synthase [Alienimonas californiensis]
MSVAPPVVVGMPVRNAERYLPEALDSLLGQTFGDFELVISDNASTDGTEALCRAAAARDDRVRYERLSENVGAIENFNRLARAARGCYFKWAASDDLCSPTFLERCVERLDGDGALAWCHPLTRHIDGDGDPIAAQDDPAIPAGEPNHSLTRVGATGMRFDRTAAAAWRRFRAVVLGTTWCSDSYGLIRLDALRRTALLPPFFGAEKVLMADLALHGRFAEIPEVLFSQRIHADAASNLGGADAERTFARAAAGAGKFSSTRLALLRGYASAVRRADLSAADRFHCFTTLGLYVGQVGKWGRVLKSAAAGRGVGDDTFRKVAARRTASRTRSVEESDR